VTLDKDQCRIVATALTYAMQLLAHLPPHWVRPHTLFEMDRLLSALAEDEKQLQRARQVAASHVARMLKTPEKRQ
jgi:hypothetical protein